MSLLFHTLLYAHIAVGAIGLLAFWVPVLTRKGGRRHVGGGRVFAYCMLAVGILAVGISTTTLAAPVETHPQLADDVVLVRGIFGWMMLYLAVLTVNLAWYGLLCVRNRRDHRANGAWHNLALQGLVMGLALHCAVHGLRIGQPLMVGMAPVGIAAGLTNLAFILRRSPPRMEWQLEHIKGLIGAGISVYTAFLAFGAVRFLPEAALSPVLWSIPLTIGLALIIGFRQQVIRRHRRSAPMAAAGADAAAALSAALVRKTP